MRASALGIPTRSSSSAARCSAPLPSISKCVSSASRIWRPIVSTGFNDVIGSWKIIAISRPRMRRSARSLWRIRSAPSNTAVPDSTRPLRASRPRMASDVTLFSHPDSPTIPSVSPDAMSNEIPFTACTVPRRVQKRTWRLSTERSAVLSTAAQLRIERLPQAVPDEVEPENRDHDGEPRDDREVWRALQVPIDVREHRAPFRRGGILRSEPEETESGNVDDRRRERECPLDDHGGDRIREDVRDKDATAWHADRARGEDEVVLFLREDRAAQKPGEDRDIRYPDRDHDLKETGAEHGDDPDRQQETGNGEHDVHQSHDHGVDEPAHVACRGPEHHPDGQARGDGDHADQEREPRSVEDARELVATQLVDAEPVMSRWPRAAPAGNLREILSPRIEGRDDGRQERNGDEGGDERESDKRSWIPTQDRPGVAPEPARGFELNLRGLELGYRHDEGSLAADAATWLERRRRSCGVTRARSADIS